MGKSENAGAHLKSKQRSTFDQKLTMIHEILTNFGLISHKDTETCRLSGGQRKRLSIAQELVNNPQVMFLDEPTSGLDSQASFECISVLKKLVKDSEQRTIICTIHQPSAKLFELFDMLYVMANGECIYRGSAPSVLPYLTSQNLLCPAYHNPADFVIEVACGVYGDVQSHLAELVRSGKCDNLNSAFMPLVDRRLTIRRASRPKPVPRKAQRQKDRKTINKTSVIYDSMLDAYDAIVGGRTQMDTPTSAPIGMELEACNDSGQSRFFNVFADLVNSFEGPKDSPTQDLDQNGMTSSKVSSQLHIGRSNNYYDWRFLALLPFTRFFVLLLRTFKCIVRDKNLTWLRLGSHIVVGLLIGWLYFDIGNDPKKVMSNKACIFLSLLFLMFTALMPTVMTFPLEMTVFLREHLNSWYSLTMYYFAKTLADMPFQILFPLVYSVIIYFMTSQPFECFRFFLFLSVSILVSVNAQSLGLLIGAAASSLQVAVFSGPITAIPILLFSGFFLKCSSITVYLRWLCHCSYIGYAYDCSLIAVYGSNRTINTNNDQPETWNAHIHDLHEDDWWKYVIIMISFFVAFRLMTLAVLCWRVMRRT